MTVQFRDYQEKQAAEIEYAFNHVKNVACQSPTGSGKTVLFSGIAERLKLNTVALAHRQELVSQMSRTFARNGIEHSIVGSTKLIRQINRTHLAEFGRTYYRPNSKVRVVSVDTLTSKKQYQAAESWGKEVGLWIMDEGHHLLQSNKWGKAVDLFPNALGLGVSAWFGRGDGKGLGANAQGYYEALVKGPEPIELIKRGFLSNFKMYGPQSDIDVSGLTVSSNTGDYSQRKLTERVRESHIIGDIVEHYIKLARGKLGVTFVTDIETANKVAEQFNASGIPAVAISSHTPDSERFEMLQKFARREVMQLVNVDIFGEGFDCPAIEVVSFARPTESYSLYIQQFGRALRILEGKEHAIIIDHVGNITRHGGAPLVIKEPMFENREGGSRKKSGDEIKLKTCTKCLAIYEAYLTACPDCGFSYVPEDRSKPEFVDGDLVLLDQRSIDELLLEIEASETPPYFPDSPVGSAMRKNFIAKLEVKEELRSAIALWAGYKRHEGLADQERYRLFYNKFGTDVLSAQAMNRKESQSLLDKIKGDI